MEGDRRALLQKAAVSAIRLMTNQPACRFAGGGDVNHTWARLENFGRLLSTFIAYYIPYYII